MSRSQDPIHGFIYQLKLLMLFLHRGIKHKYDFILRTEMKAAGSFDDLVFEYRQDDEKFFRILQAKHSLDKNKKEPNKITAADLFAGPQKDQKYSLIKYYYSYMNSKEESLFKGGSFKDLIICTNIDFNIEDLTSKNIVVHEVTEEDNILDINISDTQKKTKRYIGDLTSKRIAVHEVREQDHILDINISETLKKTKRYRFDKDFADLLKPKLEEYYDLSIVKKLVKFILGNKQLYKNAFGTYGPALISDVIDQEKKRLSEAFVKNIDLSDRVSKFREMLDFEIEKQSKDELNLITLHEAMVKEKPINGKTIALNVHRNFGRNFDKKQSKWPQKNIDTNVVKEFLSLLIFAVTPNEDELGEAIREENMEQFNKITTVTIYNRLFQHMVDFLQDKQHIEGTRIEFWSYKDGQKFIDDTCFEIIHLQLSGFRNHLDSISCKFKQSFSERINDFINSRKTLWLLTSQAPCLSSLAIYQSIRNDNQVKNIFIYKWGDLLDNKGEILLDFEHLENFFIIISCLQMIGSEYFITKIVENIKKIFPEPMSYFKKIIVIASEKHEIQRKLKKEFQVFYSQEFNIRFSDMDETSQSLILKKENITFQGKHQMSLEKLLNIKDCDSEQQIDILNLDAASTELLLCSSQLRIFNQTNDFNSLTYKPNKTVTSNSILKEIKRNEEDIFAFHVDDEKIKLMFLSKGINLMRFNVTDSLHQIKKYRFILLDLQREETEFNFLCQIIHDYASDIYKPALHRLKYVGGNKWLWMHTFNINFYISRYYVPNTFSWRILNMLSEENSFDFILFSGLVKKEFLKKVRMVFECIYRSTHEANTSKYNIIESIFSNYRGHTFSNNCSYTFAKPKQIAKRRFHFFSKILKDSQSYDPNDIYLPATQYHSKKAIHWLKIQTELDIWDNQTLIFEWQQSSGNITALHPTNVCGRNIEKKYCKSEDNLVHLNQRLVLLSGGPGTGKSCTLTRIIQNMKKSKPTSLIIEINLNKLQRSSDSFCVKSKNQLIELLFPVLKESSTYAIEKKIIEYKMEYPEQLILLFDGFDEIVIEKKESALSLFIFIMQKTRANLWITTRSQNEKELQNSLGVLKYSFLELDDKYKAFYLRYFLLTSLKFSERDSPYNFLISLFDVIDINFHSIFMGFTNVPLMLRFVVEKYIDVLNDSETQDVSFTSRKIQKIRLADVFESFVRHAYEIYFVEKMKIVEWFDSDSKTVLRDAYSNAYRCLAVKHIINDNSFSDPNLFSNDSVKAFSESMIEKISLATLSKIGLIEIYDSKKEPVSTVNIYHSKNEQIHFSCSTAYDNVQFIHPLFQKFFAVEFAYNKLKTYPSLEILWEFLIDKVLLNTFTLEIFENMLAKDNELSNLSSKYPQNKIIFNLHLRQTKGMYTRPALWMAADFGLIRTVIFLSKCFLDSDNFSKALKEIFDLPENYFGYGVIPDEFVFANYIINADRQKHTTNMNLVVYLMRKETLKKSALQYEKSV